MATQVQFRGGTTTEHASFNGAAREVTVDTTKQTLVVQDGSTNGGFPLLREKNPNNLKAVFGNNNDLEIYSNGDSFITNTTSTQFAIQSDNLRLRSKTDNENYIVCTDEAGVQIYWDGSPKFETTADGTATTGNSTINYAGSASGKITLTLGANNSSGSTSLTNSTSKAARIGVYHYTNAEEPAAILYAVGSDTTNQVNYGGGTSWMNAATHHKFFTADDTTTASGTEKLRIDGNGRVSINTDTPHCANKGVHIKTGDSGVTSASTNRDDIFIEGSDHAGITISTANNKTGGIGFDDPDGNRGRVQYSHTSDKMQIYTSGTNSFEFTSDLDILDGNLKVANGHGIDFSAVELDDSDAADGYSVYASILDDYERGTFTPEWDGSTTSPSITYTSNGQLGYYHKVGRRVYFQIYLCLASSGNSSVGGSGTLCITGFPYAADTAVSGPEVAFGGGVVAYNDKMGSSSIKNLLMSGSALYCYNGVDGSGSSTSKATTDLTNSSQIRIFGSYISNV